MSLIVKRPVFDAQVRGWLDAGQLHAPETSVEGLDQTPAAFIGLLQGRNAGRFIVKLTGDGSWT